jgi:hypothetical protein
LEDIIKRLIVCGKYISIFMIDKGILGILGDQEIFEGFEILDNRGNIVAGIREELEWIEESTVRVVCEGDVLFIEIGVVGEYKYVNISDEWYKIDIMMDDIRLRGRTLAFLQNRSFQENIKVVELGQDSRIISINSINGTKGYWDYSIKSIRMETEDAIVLFACNESDESGYRDVCEIDALGRVKFNDLKKEYGYHAKFEEMEEYTGR